MFDKVLLAATPPGARPAAGPLVVWHPDTFDWVRLEPADLLADSVEPGFLERSARVLPADAERTPTGPELAAVLAAFDAGSAGAYDLVEAAAGWARLAAWVAAGEADVLAELTTRHELRPAESTCRSVHPVTVTAVEVAGRCQRTVKQAENLVGHSVQLVDDFASTHAALSAGLIDLRRARVITDELGGQDPAVRELVEADVLPEAPFIDAVALRKLIKRRLHQLAPVETAERNRVARDGRYVAVTPASDGMAFLEALLPAEDATALHTALNSAAADAKRADAAAGLPVRPHDHRRADALAELAWAALAACADVAGGGAAGGGAAGGGAAGGGAAGGGAAGGGAAGGGAGRTLVAHAADTDHPVAHAADADHPVAHAADAHRPDGRGAGVGGAGHAAGVDRARGQARARATSAASPGIATGTAGAGQLDRGGGGWPGGPPAGATTAATTTAATTTATTAAATTTATTAAATTAATTTATTTAAAAPPMAGAGGESTGAAPRADASGPRGSALRAGAGGESAGAAPRAGAGGPRQRAPRAGAGGVGRPAARSTRRRSVSVHVTVPFTTLTGLSDEPGELEGYGPIPAHVARALAAEGVWTWLRADPATGQLLDLGRTRYRPSRALARFITARDRTCRMPGCHRSARAADIDHIVPFAAGGPTSRANLQALCETHHLIKHLGRWSAERRPGGSTRWTSPTGHRYLKRPG
ncbi:HNH endonuclease signature motif containing protein [Jiangella endophytica]|uniref:HNH endonuclease signature motif containing protein n=1 Tax=Jiangella endophytica TaxID=1623398 RepID=UPI000E3427F8|nr:HNH endonuclease signature motif containing protein [Jiangella endophytica]